MPCLKTTLAAAALLLCLPAAATQFHIPYFLSASNPAQQSFLRIVWPSCRTRPNLSIMAVDDAGTVYGPIEIPWRAGPGGCGQVVAFNSDDLEYGNADKGFSVGVGQGVGDWQLFVESSTDVTVQTFVRTSDGFLTAMHDCIPFSEERNAYYVATFNPAKNTDQQSRLRLVNPNEFQIHVNVLGQHDNLVGSYDYGQKIPIPPRGVVTVTAEDLETVHSEWADGPYDGKLGNANQIGKWRLYLRADAKSGERPEFVAMNLMETPTGHLTNLSSIPYMGLVGDMPSTTAPPDPDPEPDPEPNPPSSDGTFDIEVFFANGVGEVPRVLEYAYRNAARRWERIVARGFDNQTISLSRGQCHSDRDMADREIDDLLVIVRMANLGGKTGSAASAAPCLTEGGSTVARRPFVGWVDVNVDHWNDKSIHELTSSQPHPLTEKIAIHELGHVLGFSGDTIQAAGYLRQSPNTHFAGPRAREAFRETAYDGRYDGEPVPMEFGHAHWHEQAFTAGAAYPEIMAPAIAKQSLLSEITVAALADLGYEVDFGQADQLPYGVSAPGVSEMIDLSDDLGE